DPAIREGSYALYLGRLARRKGVDVLLKALTELPAEPGVRLVVAGSGDDEAELRALAASHALGDRVRFVGRVDGADKLYLLQNAIATVMPSRVWEAFPLVVLESFAAGRAVIGTRVPGIADLVENDKTGILFEDENVS